MNNYLLTINTDNDGEAIVNINVHNLIKTIVFGEIYRNQEQKIVFDILNDIEESKNEYTYIDIVVSNEELTDFESFRQIFLGEENTESMAKDLFELVNNNSRISNIQSVEKKNNNLLGLDIIRPIIDDFLRFHRDTERLEFDTNKKIIMPVLTNNNTKNIQLALLYQQRKKKENTKAQLIINKIDSIADYYSENVINNPETKSNIKKYFHGPLAHRKAVLHNYIDEVRVMNKIINQGRRAMESNEYFLEIKQANSKAYFNFKDFQKYGTNIILETETPITMIRYSNIEFKNQLSNQIIETRTAVNDNIINLVGCALGPFNNFPVQCVKKDNLVDIRDITIRYPSSDEIRTLKIDNGYKMFVRIIKHFYINTIKIKTEPKIEIYNDMEKIYELNKDIFDKVVYWIYDIDKDIYEMDTYEDVKSYNFQENIKFMNSKIYDKIIIYLNKKLINLLNMNTNLSISKAQLMIELYSNINKLFMKQSDKRELIIREFLQKQILEKGNIFEATDEEIITKPIFKTTEEEKFIESKLIRSIHYTHKNILS